MKIVFTYRLEEIIDESDDCNPPMNLILDRFHKTPSEILKSNNPQDTEGLLQMIEEYLQPRVESEIRQRDGEFDIELFPDEEG